MNSDLRVLCYLWENINTSMPRIPKTRACLSLQHIQRRVHVRLVAALLEAAMDICISTLQSSWNTVWSTSLSHFISSENGARSLWQDRCFGIHISLECCTKVSISVPCKNNSDTHNHVTKSCGHVWSSDPQRVRGSCMTLWNVLRSRFSRKLFSWTFSILNFCFYHVPTRKLRKPVL